MKSRTLRPCDSKLKQQDASAFHIMHSSLFWQFTSPAGTNVHSMLINTTEAVSALEDSYSNSYCLIHLGNNPPKTWLQSLTLVCIKQVFSVTPQITLSAFTINHLTISCNSSFNEKKKSWSNWPWLISCETPSNYLFLLLYHHASMNSPPSSVLNKAHRELTLSTPIKHIWQLFSGWLVGGFFLYFWCVFLENTLKSWFNSFQKIRADRSWPNTNKQLHLNPTLDRDQERFQQKPRNKAEQQSEPPFQRGGGVDAHRAPCVTADRRWALTWDPRSPGRPVSTCSSFVPSLLSH